MAYRLISLPWAIAQAPGIRQTYFNKSVLITRASTSSWMPDLYFYLNTMLAIRTKIKRGNPLSFFWLRLSRQSGVNLRERTIECASLQASYGQVINRVIEAPSQIKVRGTDETFRVIIKNPHSYFRDEDFILIKHIQHRSHTWYPTNATEYIF